MQAIEVTPGSATAQNTQASFTATGHFNTAPMIVTNLSVSWVMIGPASDPPDTGYALIPSPYNASCRAFAKYVVVAYAPMDPNAPSSGPMSAQTWNDVVITQSATQEGGFVGGSAQLTCP